MRRRRVIGLLALWVVALTGLREPRAKSAEAWHGPKVVLIIRHAEKPVDAQDPDLSPRGRERAAALARRFADAFPRPDFILATRRSKHSNRPVETVEKLAEALHERVEADHMDDEFAEEAREVLTDPRFDGKVVMICWHHGKIPGLAHALGAADAPARWNADAFDRVWQIDFANGKSTFHDKPQRMLPGDSPE